MGREGDRPSASATEGVGVEETEDVDAIGGASDEERFLFIT